MSRESFFDFLSISASALVVGAALFFIFNRESGNQLQASALSVEELYARVEAQLAASEGILHVSFETTTTGPGAYSLSGEQWLDGVNKLAREELEYTPAASFASIATDSEYYLRSGDADATVSPAASRRCYGAGIAASTLLGCQGAGTQSVKRVEEGRYLSRNVFVLIETGTSESAGQTLSFTHRLFLDAQTLMPLSAQAEGSWNAGQAVTEPYSGQTIYEVETLTLAALGEDFFSPAEVGFVVADPESGIRGQTSPQVFWLGPTFEMPGEGQYVLQSSFSTPDRGSPYKFSLLYARADAPLDPPFLNLQIYFLDMWDAAPMDPNEASFLGETVVFFTEIQPQGETGRLLTPEIYDALKAALIPYGEGTPPPESPLPPAEPVEDPALAATPVQAPGPAFVPQATAVPTATPQPPPPVIEPTQPPPPPEPTPIPTATTIPTIEPTVDFPFEEEEEPTSTPVPPTSTPVPSSTPQPTATTPPSPTPESPTATPEPPTATPPSEPLP